MTNRLRNQFRPPDGSHLRNSDDFRIFVKSIPANFGNTVGNNHFGQPGATSEGTAADFGHAVGNNHFGQPSATFKSIVADFGHAVFDDNLHRGIDMFQRVFSNPAGILQVRVFAADSDSQSFDFHFFFSASLFREGIRLIPPYFVFRLFSAVSTLIFTIAFALVSAYLSSCFPVLEEERKTVENPDFQVLSSWGAAVLLSLFMYFETGEPVPESPGNRWWYRRLVCSGGEAVKKLETDR